MAPKGKLIIEVGLGFTEDPESELNQLKAILRRSDQSPRKELHNNIKEFIGKVNAGPPTLKSIEYKDIFMYSIKDPDDPEEEDPN